MSKRKNVQQKSLRLSVRNRRRLVTAKLNDLTRTLRRLTGLVGLIAILAWAAPNAIADDTIAVIENDGTMFNANGTLNTPNIVRRFYANHSDAFDFVVIFTSQTHQGTETAWRARNDVTGIGLPLSALPSNWGSAGKVLTGITSSEKSKPKTKEARTFGNRLAGC